MSTVPAVGLLPGKRALALGAAVIAGVTGLATTGSYTADVAFSIVVAAAAASAWNISAGYAGDLSLGHGAFYGLGAYSSALLLVDLRVTPWVGAIVGAVIAGAVAAVLGLVTIRLRGPFYAIATLGLVEICAALSLYFVKLTSGGSGISILSPPSFWHMEFVSRWPYVLVMLLLLSAIVLVSRAIRQSTFGYRLLAFRENEVAARALGIPPVRARIIALVVSAALIAMVGAVQVQYLQFISASSAFTLTFSVQVALVAIVGGIGTVGGPLLGACIIVPVGTLLVPWLTAAGGYQQLVYGILLVAALLLFRDGAVGLLARIRRGMAASRRRRTDRSIEKVTAEPRRAPTLAASDQAGDRHSQQEASQPILVVAGVSIAFGGVRALDHASITVRRGSITALIGPNGAGKSTLFSVLSGFAIPAEGSVCFDGQEIAAVRPEVIARRGLVRTFQTSQLFTELTVVENVLIGALASSPDLASARARAEQLLDQLELSRFAKERADALSLGDRRRLELGRALAADPSLLLLDEILAGLSAQEYEDTISVLLAARDAHVTVLMTEHIMDAITRMSDEVYVLDRGRVIASGLPDEVKDDPRVVTAYLGTGVDDARRQSTHR